MRINRLWIILLPVLSVSIVLTGLLHTSAAQTAESRYKTLPDLPPITTHVRADAVSDGYIFLTPGDPFNDELLILDNNSEPVYYKRAPEGDLFYDFKVQPDGSLTYIHMELSTGRSGTIYQMDNTYSVINSLVPVGDSSLIMDEHEFQILPNGNGIYLTQKNRVVDMTGVITGGLPNAVAVDMLIQEADADNNLLFEWNGGDHYDVDDTLEPGALTEQTIDYIHSNSIEIDYDGNILLSSRELSEVSKIDRQTGELIWRMGGNHNQFTLIGDDQFFTYQHDARRVSTDTITIFDNVRDYDRLYLDNSRVIEYRLDEENKTAELVWEYEHPGGVWSWIMGNAQRQENGNTMIGWGSGGYNGIRERRLFSEVSADGELLLDVEIKDRSSYRAFRFDWEGYPAEPPTLIVEQEGSAIHLYYSWNGATEVAEYHIYSGLAPDALSLIGTQTKTGFEESSIINNAAINTTLYYQIVPVDAAGNELTPSDTISILTIPTMIGLSSIELDHSAVFLLILLLTTTIVTMTLKFTRGHR